MLYKRKKKRSVVAKPSSSAATSSSNGKSDPVSTPESRDYFDIDLRRLDEEWLMQPRMFRKSSRALADASADYERAKAKRKVVDAIIDKEVRTDPSSFDVATKLSEKVVENTILLDPRHQEAFEEEIAAKHKMDMLEADVKTLDQRKYALQDLVQLEARDYFATPRVPYGARGVSRGEGQRKMEEAFSKKKKDNH